MRTAPLFRAAPIVFGIALAAFGLLSIGSQDFAFQWQPVTESVAYRNVWAVLVGVLELVTGIALTTRKGRDNASLVAVLIYSGWSLLHVTQIFAKPADVSVWLGLAEPLAITLGVALIVVDRRDNTGAARKVVLALFGATLLVFGLAHFVYAAFTADMIPAWLPQRLAWAYFTGVAHVLAGVSILAGPARILAAILEAGMLLVFALLVHVPRIVAAPQSRIEWTMLFVALSLSTACVFVARSAMTHRYLRG